MLSGFFRKKRRRPGCEASCFASASMPRGSAPIVPCGSAFRISLWQIHGSRRRAGARVSSGIFSFMVWAFFLTRGYRKRCWDFIVSGSCDSWHCPYSTPQLRLPYLPISFANTRLPPSSLCVSFQWDFWFYGLGYISLRTLLEALLRFYRIPVL